MVETEGHKPFLTVNITEGDAGIFVRCPELHVDIGFSGQVERNRAIKCLRDVVKTNAQIIVRREDITGEEKELARKIVGELSQGVEIAELFKSAE